MPSATEQAAAASLFTQHNYLTCSFLAAAPHQGTAFALGCREYSMTGFNSYTIIEMAAEARAAFLFSCSSSHGSSASFCRSSQPPPRSAFPCAVLATSALSSPPGRCIAGSLGLLELGLVNRRKKRRRENNKRLISHLLGCLLPPCAPSGFAARSSWLLRVNACIQPAMCAPRVLSLSC